MAYNLSGWRWQPKDPRDDYLIFPTRRSASQLIDLTSGMGPYRNQGAQGSCGPHTADEMVAFLQKLEGLPVVGAAPHFTYWYTRYLMGTVGQDSGVDNRSMCKALNQYGFLAESLDPYSDSLAAMVKSPTAEMNAAALPNVITDYKAVVQNLTQMQGALLSGRPFMFGFEVFNGIMSPQAERTGIIPDPKRGESPIGGHDMTCCGINLGPVIPGVLPGNVWPSGSLRLRQHWLKADGSPWGDGGYGYVSIAFATNAQHSGDFWIFNTIPGALPPNPPVPPVPPPGAWTMTVTGAGPKPSVTGP